MFPSSTIPLFEIRNRNYFGLIGDPPLMDGKRGRSGTIMVDPISTAWQPVEHDKKNRHRFQARAS
jgi:hypothetical protein